MNEHEMEIRMEVDTNNEKAAVLTKRKEAVMCVLMLLPGLEQRGAN